MFFRRLLYGFFWQFRCKSKQTEIFSSPSVMQMSRLTSKCPGGEIKKLEQCTFIDGLYQFALW